MEESLDKIVAKKGLEAYIAHERANNRLRSLSESTGASPSGALQGLSDDQREEAVARTVAQREFGGDKFLFLNTVFGER